MFGIVPFQFRFRGKINIILDMYYCFLEAGSVALHPTQIAKKTGVSFAEVARRLRSEERRVGKEGRSRGSP